MSGAANAVYKSVDAKEAAADGDGGVASKINDCFVVTDGTGIHHQQSCRKEDWYSLRLLHTLKALIYIFLAPY